MIEQAGRIRKQILCRTEGWLDGSRRTGVVLASPQPAVGYSTVHEFIMTVGASQFHKRATLLESGRRRELAVPELEETIQEAVEHGKESKLNSIVAVLVAVSATFMAVCNVKDGNIVQAMEQAQARSIDRWAYYQAKGTKQNLAEQTVDELV